jgi:hypothetical protein
MSAPPLNPGAEYIASRGPWHFTRESVVGPALVDDFYALYSLAFDPLKKLSAARQVLNRGEFDDQMTDARVDKFVARDHAGTPVGLTTLTRTLETVPWISPDYFAETFPEHWARNAVYYLGFTLSHPSYRHQRFLETFIRVGLERAIAQHGVIAYDACAYNAGMQRFEERIQAVLQTVPGGRVGRIDAQYYFCLTLP